MNDATDNERLLKDVLAEDAPVGFRETLLAGTLRQVRRRRQTRHAGQALGALALILGLFLGAWHGLIPRARSPEAPKAYVLVRTHPLPALASVQTTPLAPGMVVRSQPVADMLTTAASGYRTREIDDDELLALAAPKSVVLVRYSPHQAELVFADSADSR